MVHKPRDATLPAVDLFPTAREVGVSVVVAIVVAIVVVVVVGGFVAVVGVVAEGAVEFEDDLGDRDGTGADVHDAFAFAFNGSHGEQGAREIRCVCVCVCVQKVVGEWFKVTRGD